MHAGGRSERDYSSQRWKDRAPFSLAVQRLASRVFAGFGTGGKEEGCAAGAIFNMLKGD
nr:hypothetical protein [Paenibacillus glycanilyticus]